MYINNNNNKAPRIYPFGTPPDMLETSEKELSNLLQIYYLIDKIETI